MPHKSMDNKRLPKKIQQLRRILRAFAVTYPDIGYCQGLNFIATLLLLIDHEEKVFWLMISLYVYKIPRYHTIDMHMMKIDQNTLNDLLERRAPRLVRHILNQGFTIPLLTTKLFTCLFIQVLPFDTVLRIWDVFLSEGNKIIFRIAIALFIIHERKLLSLTGSDLYHYAINMGHLHIIR